MEASARGAINSVNPEPLNCYFALGADRDMFYNWVVEVLEKDKARRGL